MHGGGGLAWHHHRLYSGCGNGDGLVTPTEVVEVTETVVDRYDGDSIYFEQAGTIHEGRVVKGVSATEVLVRLADSSEMVIGVDHIAGTLLADHPDLGTSVIMLGDRDQGEKIIRGKIEGVYSDGMRKIELLTASLLDGTRVKLDGSRFVDEDTDFEEGGYLTREEFGRLIDNF